MEYTDQAMLRILALITRIVEKTQVPEVLAQLAEESAELTHAALKLRRVLTQDSPTPVSQEEALENLLEEMADVAVCQLVLGVQEEDEYYERVRSKLQRWVDRLEGKADV